MSLYTTVGAKNIPEGAVKLSREEALKFQKKIIRSWKSLGDVVFLEYGWLASAATTTASSVYITGLIRSLLNTGSIARVGPYFVTATIPSLLSGFFTERVVTDKLLLMSTGCPMCLQLHFGVMQSIFSVVLPTIISLGCYLPLAQIHRTISLPDITQDSREGYKFCFKLLKRRAINFQMVAALQIPLVFLLPYMQAKQLDKITKILRDSETVSELE